MTRGKEFLMVRKEMPSTPADERLGQQMMTIDEVARLLNVHTNTVRQWNHRGLLNAYRLGPRGDRRTVFVCTRARPLRQAQGRLCTHNT